jgi:outer membrane protein OmpA-like peptidoglycan-associated protein
LVQAEAVRAAPATRQAESLAPQAVAHAEQLRLQAEAAFARGASAEASLLAERALVAYQRAAVLARIATATLQARSAQSDLDSTVGRLEELRTEHRRANADIEALQQLILVVKDAPAIAHSAPATPERENARTRSARAAVADARMLCAAASLLGRPVDGLDATEAAVQRLADTVAQWPRPAPIDEARRLRSQCLALLSLARRTSGLPAGAGSADELLAALSARPGLDPVRDDRGVAVTIRGDPADTKGNVAEKLRAIAEAAATHPNFPVLVVAHTRYRASKAEHVAAEQRAQRVVRELTGAGIPDARLRAVHAGADRPVVHEPVPPPPNSQNDRTEVVFVAPTS